MPVYIDISRCIGCRSCEVACQRVHAGIGHINVHFVGDQASVPIFCHQCEEAGCVMACFSGALCKDEGKRTVFDAEKCTGCELCRLACPFGVVWTATHLYALSPVRPMLYPLISSRRLAGRAPERREQPLAEAEDDKS
jgi:Fe-S-cluster-containing hydrogenase component 2